MKCFLSASLIGLISLSAFAASPDCENDIQRLSRRTRLYQAVESSLSSRKNIGRGRVRQAGPIFDAFQLQKCRMAPSTETASVQFKVPAGRSGSQPKVYLCLSKQRRVNHLSGHVGSWSEITTRCKVAQNQELPPAFDDGGYHGGANDYGPDEVYDPDFYRRSPYYGGPDEVSDGSGAVIGSGDGGSPIFNEGSGSPAF